VQSFLPYPWPGLEDITGFHEGMADSLAAVFFQTHCIGKDFYGAHTGCVRDLNDLYVYPVDSNSSHTRGRALSGAFWDLNLLLLEKYNSANIVRNKMRLLMGTFLAIAPQGLDSTVLQRVLVAERATFGTDFNEINQAFNRHGF